MNCSQEHFHPPLNGIIADIIWIFSICKYNVAFRITGGSDVGISFSVLFLDMINRICSFTERIKKWVLPARKNVTHQAELSPHHLFRCSMDHQDLRILKILNEIDGSRIPSQRDLARKLNVSLGLVNSFIKRLAQKGYFKVTNVSKNRIRYILTPKGIAEKTRLTCDYIQFSFGYYQKSRQDFREIFNGFVLQGVSRIALFGVSDLAEIAFLSVQETPLSITAVFDDKKEGEKFLGFQICSPDALSSSAFDRVLITGNGNEEYLLESALQKGIPREKIVMMGKTLK
jgi:DNA-binding MarR family transcriptional regulator